MFLVALKGTFAVGVLAVSELVASGQMGVAVAAAPPLTLMWLLTRRQSRLHAARRRAQEGAG